MTEKVSSEVEALWRRVGLEKLRLSLRGVEDLTKRFETALESLPRCNECARAMLLDQIREAGEQLSGEVLSLCVLAGTLKEAVKVTENVTEELNQRVPTPCRCHEKECTCHAFSGTNVRTKSEKSQRSV